MLRRRGGSRYVEGCWGTRNIFGFLVVGFLAFGFLVCSFQISWFIGCCFLSFLVSKLFDFKVSWFLAFKVAWFQSFEELQTQCPVLWKVLIPYSRCSTIFNRKLHDFPVPAFSRSFNIFGCLQFQSLCNYFQTYLDLFLDCSRYPGVPNKK